MIELVDIPLLGSQLLVVSSVTKVLVDIMKSSLEEAKDPSKAKLITSYILSIVLAATFQLSLFEPDVHVVTYYFGCLLAGLIAGLGSNYMNDLLKGLQALKQLKK